jgi:hypothetical protein
MREIKKIFEAKFRYIVGFLVGSILAIVLILCFFVVIPEENEVTVAEIRTCFAMAFGAFIQHVMKTPQPPPPPPRKEPNETYSGE